MIAFTDLDTELYADAYERLDLQRPRLLSAIRKAFTDGETPSTIRQRVYRQTYNAELAALCESAARHVAGGAQ